MMITELLYCNLVRQKMPFVCEHIGLWGQVSDLIAINRGHYSFEYEIKTSYSNFKTDFKKVKHDEMRKRSPKDCANYFYFACPAGVIPKSEVPLQYGLIYLFGETYKSSPYVSIEREASELHRHTLTNKQLFSAMAALSRRRIFPNQFDTHFSKQSRFSRNWGGING